MTPVSDHIFELDLFDGSWVDGNLSDPCIILNYGLSTSFHYNLKEFLGFQNPNSGAEPQT